MFDVLFLVLAAAGQEAAQPAPSTQEKPPIVIEGKRREKKVCKKMEAPTGSRLGGGRVCRTAFDWKLSEQAAEQALEKHRQRESAMQAYNENAKNGLLPQGPP